MNYIELFSMLNHPLRFDMLVLLKKRELCICELERLLDAKQYQISRHMKILKDASLVNVRKQDKYHYYSLNKLDKKANSLLAFLESQPDSRMANLDMALEELDNHPIVCER
jgi:ArsR family transcriptional regulator